MEAYAATKRAKRLKKHEAALDGPVAGPAEGPMQDPRDISQNVLARVACLVIEPRAKAILDEIFSLDGRCGE